MFVSEPPEGDTEDGWAKNRLGGWPEPTGLGSEAKRGLDKPQELKEDVKKDRTDRGEGWDGSP